MMKVVQKSLWSGFNLKKKNELSTSKSSSGNNHLSQTIVHASSDKRMMENALSKNILNPNCSRSKGRPKKLRKKRLIRVEIEKR